MALNHVSMPQANLPKPLSASYPDGGSEVIEYAVDDPSFRITAHPDGVFRVWRIERRIGDWNYYPIRVIGMTPDEIRRAATVACQLLSLPHNRGARRARSAVH